MSNKIKTKMVLSNSALDEINKRVETLSNAGVQISEEHSGEMNFSGCKSGYCQAWA